MTNTNITSVYYPDYVRMPVSGAAACNNPNCCSTRAAACKDGGHNKHCCKAMGNKACDRREWRVLYAMAKPDADDTLRRRCMARWLAGHCTLKAANEEYEARRAQLKTAMDWKEAA